MNGAVDAPGPSRYVPEMDHLTPERRSWLMSRVRGKDTKPELAVLRALRRLGKKPQRHVASLPGRPDFVFPRLKKAIFVHGCFWHRHKGCKHATTPKTRRAFWNAKFAANVKRDQRVRRELHALGYEAHLIWQCWAKSENDLSARLEILMARRRLKSR